MTISTTTNRVSITGNGVTTAISFPYYFLSNSDLVVIQVTIATGAESTLVLNTGYTVTGAGNLSGGTVTLTSAPSSSYNVVVYRNPALTQAADFKENEALPAATLEQSLDKSVMLHQRTREIVTRSLRQPEGDIANIDYLPAKATRASKYLAFDSDGDPVATAGTTDATVISTFMATVVDDTSASAARTTLGAAGLTGNETIAGTKTFSGTPVFAGGYTNQGIVQNSNTISPSQITSNQNNYSPTGNSTAYHMRLDLDAARTLTGLGDGVAGFEKKITNLSAYWLTLAAESASSTAANRFAGSIDHLIPPYGSATLYYDSTSSRWRVVGITPFRESIAIFTHDVADGTDGGQATTGAWTKLAGIAELRDPDSIASASSGVMTMATGTYEVTTWKTATGAVSGFRTKIRDTSNSADYALSMTGRHSTSGENIIEIGSDIVTITASTNFEFQYFASATVGSTDLGDDDNVTAGSERYAIVRWRRIRP